MNKSLIILNNIHFIKFRKNLILLLSILRIFILILIILILLFLIKYEKFHPLKYEPNYRLRKEILKKKLLNEEIINKYNQLDIKIKEKLKIEGLVNCFLKEYYCIYPLLIPKKVIGKNLTLIGGKRDGGYVLLDDFENMNIAYSFGISNETSFDKSLADKNFDVYMYDHTIESLPFNNSKFHWKKIGLSGNKNKTDTLKPLKDLLLENGHLNEKNMLLKIDVEYSEWEALYDISEDILKKFKYILLEFHFWKNETKYYYSILKKLLDSHEIFYMHCNGCGKVITFGKNKICDALEVSYVLRKNTSLEKMILYIQFKILKL